MCAAGDVVGEDETQHNGTQRRTGGYAVADGQEMRRVLSMGQAEVLYPGGRLQGRLSQKVRVRRAGVMCGSGRDGA